MSRAWWTPSRVLIAGFFVLVVLYNCSAGETHAQTSGITPQDFVLIPNKDGSLVVKLPSKTVQKCVVQGGCRITTLAELDAFARAIAAVASKSCGREI